jgi:ketosteroid isomerase-like protein
MIPVLAFLVTSSIALSPGLAQTAQPKAEPSPAAKLAPKVEWKTDPNEKELLRAERALMEAIRDRDRAKLERMVAAEFAYTGPLSTGDLTQKGGFVAQMTGGISVQSFSFEKIVVRSFGDVAIVNTLCRQTGLVAGRPWNPEYLYTDVWVKRGDAWQLATRHVTRAIRGEKAN